MKIEDMELHSYLYLHTSRALLALLERQNLLNNWDLLLVKPVLIMAPSLFLIVNVASHALLESLSALVFEPLTSCDEKMRCRKILVCPMFYFASYLARGGNLLAGHACKQPILLVVVV